ncbi:MAG: hypothetical protein WC499_02095 [Patescibacteria group bacterium]
MNEKSFLQKKYFDLPKSPEVASAVHRQEVRTNEKVKGDSNTQIETYLNRLSEIFETFNPALKEKRIDILKDKLYDSFVIKPEEVPEAYFDLQKRIARERGHGEVEINNQTRKENIDIIITDQKKSLDSWIDYLGSSDAAYPNWFKYFAFRSITKMAEYDKEKKQFKDRSNGTTSIFPDINREALAYVADELIKKQNKQPITDDQEWQKIIQGENFAKMYAYAIEKITPASQEQKEITDGQWVKFDQGSGRHLELSQSLQGHGTGWCTAGESTAQTQLENGDFYVFYTKGDDGQYAVPRIAIRMEQGQIAEVRGINAQQNLEGNMTEIAESKIATLPGAEKYKKKSVDMKRMTELEKKVKQNQELTKEDLKFLYEVEVKIDGFGYKEDPRIQEIREKRNQKNDYINIFDCSEEQIVSDSSEINNQTIVLIGDLNRNIISDWENMPSNLKHISGDAYLEYSQIKDLGQLQSIGGNISFKNQQIKDFSQLQSIGGSFDLITFPYLAQDLKLPKHIGRNLHLDGLTSAQGLELPEQINGDLYLRSLTSAKGLKLPKYIDGDLYLDGLTSAQGLELPEQINGDLYLRSLTSAKDLKFPKQINGNLVLSRLTSVEDFELPEHIGRNLYLKSLTSAQGLELPEKINGSLNLDSLTSAQGLKLPKYIGGTLYLNSLTSIEGLELPEKINGDFILNLTSVERKKLRKQYPHFKIANF